MTSLTKRAIDAAKPKDAEYFLWGADGLGLRVHPSGRKVFVWQGRFKRSVDGETKWVARRIKIGAYGPFTLEAAQKKAEGHNKAAREGDPRRAEKESQAAITVDELCDKYMEAARAGLVTTRFKRAKRASTVAIDEGRVSRHIKPLLGGILARDVRLADVQRMADSIAKGETAGVFKGKKRGKAVVTGGKGTAARVVRLLGGIYTWAEKREHVPIGTTPTRGVEVEGDKPRKRVLSPAELTALGKVLKAKGAELPAAASAVRLVALTGMRRDEACGLRWDEVDTAAHCVRLKSTKTGESMRPIGGAAVVLLEALRKTKSSDTWVFPNRDDTGSADLKKSVASIFDVAGLKDARSHDLRRTFASMADAEGYSDATIGEMLGHAKRGVTAIHYIWRPDAALVAAADKVSASIAAALDREEGPAEVIPLRRSGSAA